jgi:glycosyltransferase involved in cell wall biosynthesis
VPRVAFVTPGVLPMLRQRDGTVYGGSELRAWRFARGLADIGFEVSIVCLDNEPIPAGLLGPVSIVTQPTTPAWLTGLRRLLGTDGAAQSAPWRAADADVYVAFGVAEYNAALAEWCKEAGRPLILFAGSDADFSSEYRPGNETRNLWGSRCDRCYVAIVKATSVVVQTETQRRLLKERFERDAAVIVNPVPVEEKTDGCSPRRHVLWIGKAVSNKRPDLALVIARACPNVAFRMIANKVDAHNYQLLLNDAPPNVVVTESVRPSALRNEFANAIALLCTSDVEGFPNTFLDAGSFGVPVLSLGIDPDSILTREGGGVMTNGDLAALIKAVEQYAENPAMTQAAGERLRNYVRRHHEARGRVAEFAAEINAVLGRSSPGSSFSLEMPQALSVRISEMTRAGKE